MLRTLTVEIHRTIVKPYVVIPALGCCEVILPATSMTCKPEGFGRIKSTYSKQGFIKRYSIKEGFRTHEEQILHPEEE